MYICIFALCYFMHNTLFSIRELIDVITSNYRLVDDNFIDTVILSRWVVFHDTFWIDKVSLSSSNQGIFYIFNCLHFTSLWWFYNTMKVEDHKVLMRDRCIICGDLRSFFPPPSVEPLSCHFSFVSLTTVCDFFLLMVFMLYDIWVPFQFFVLVLISF